MKNGVSVELRSVAKELEISSGSVDNVTVGEVELAVSAVVYRSVLGTWYFVVGKSVELNNVDCSEEGHSVV